LDDQFENINESETTYEQFLEYLSNIGKNNNLEFWKYVYNYKISNNNGNAVELAKRYLGYKSGNSLVQVNDRFQVVKIFNLIEQNKINIDMFDIILQEIKDELKLHWNDFCAMSYKVKGKTSGFHKKPKKIKNSIQILRKKEDIDLFMYYNYLFCETELFTNFNDYLKNKNLHFYLDFLNEIYLLNQKTNQENEDLSLKYQILDILDNYFVEGKIDVQNIKIKVNQSKKKIESLNIKQVSVEVALKEVALEVQNVLWLNWETFCVDEKNKQTVKKLKKMIKTKKKQGTFPEEPNIFFVCK